MPPKPKAQRAAHLAGVAMALSKGVPSPTIRNPADDVQDDTIRDVQMSEVKDTDLPLVATLMVPDSQFCNFCAHKARVLRVCGSCKAMVCEQADYTEQACVPVGAGLAQNFVCPHCARVDLIKKYGFWGYCGRRHSKITWPLLLSHLSLRFSANNDLRNFLHDSLLSEFASQPQSFMMSDVKLSAGGSNEAIINLEPAVNFLRRMADSNCPSNFILVLETKSHYLTGAVAYDDAGEEPIYCSLPNLVQTFLGKDIMAEIENGRKMACINDQPEARWFKENAFSRGGWRGLILAAQGPTIRVRDRMQETRTLVDDGILDFIIVLTGPAVIPVHARFFIFNVAMAIAIDNPSESINPAPASIWEAFVRAVKAAPAVLGASPIVIIFRERTYEPKGQNQTICRQVALHAPPFNAWGVQFRACGNGCNDVLPSDLSFRVDKGSMRNTCILCGWRSCRVKHGDVADLVQNISPDLPLVFFHTYPPSPSLLNSFVRITAERRK